MRRPASLAFRSSTSSPLPAAAKLGSVAAWGAYWNICRGGFEEAGRQGFNLLVGSAPRTWRTEPSTAPSLPCNDPPFSVHANRLLPAGPTPCTELAPSGRSGDCAAYLARSPLVAPWVTRHSSLLEAHSTGQTLGRCRYPSGRTVYHGQWQATALVSQHKPSNISVVCFTGVPPMRYPLGSSAWPRHQKTTRSKHLYEHLMPMLLTHQHRPAVRERSNRRRIRTNSAFASPATRTGSKLDAAPIRPRRNSSTVKQSFRLT